MQNPLLNFSSTPDFPKISADHVMPAINHVLQQARKTLASLEKVKSPSWDNFAAKMEAIDERIGRVWSPVSHLKGVADSDQLRQAYQLAIEQLTQYHSEVSQNLALFNHYKAIRDSEAFNDLSKSQRRVINNAILDFQLGGAELAKAQQARFREIEQQLSQLSTQFEQNVLDATQSWSLTVNDISKLSGLPDTALEQARASAKQLGEEGWRFTLQLPSYLPVLQHCENADLRERMYRAYSMRASELSDDGKFDNRPLIEQILLLKHEKATLLGYDNFAELSLKKKMARDSKQVIDFLFELADNAKPKAEQELDELKAFAATQYQDLDLQPWDINYYSERLREHCYDYNDEQVRGYFPAPKVMQGLFEICNRLFNIDFRENASMPVWHDDVRCFDIFSQDNESKIGSFYTDLYVRENKRGGAWMDTCIDRHRSDETLQLPVAFLVCNFGSPMADRPSLLNHDEVETLFHEFGHTLHHLLTQVDEVSVAGINGVAWDAVELPSQFLENWCWQKEGLALISHHHQFGSTIPDELVAKMHAAKHFQTGMQTVRQVEFALFDMLIHSQSNDPNFDFQTVLKQVRQKVAVIIPPHFNRFANSFSHIFAGGYAAGYYSYKWAEVLSADAFSRFEEEGIFNAEVGKDFAAAILQRGGVEDAEQLFKEFRGREPSINALLRHSGLIEAGAEIQKQTGILA